MRQNFSEVREHNKKIAEEIHDGWYKFNATISERKVRSSLNLSPDEMVPGFWYNGEGKVVGGPDIYDAMVEDRK